VSAFDHDHVAWYTETAVAGDANEAVDYTLRLLDDGMPAGRIIDGVLAPAQREIGDRWQKGLLTAADEHVASSVTESTLYALSNASPERELLGSVVVASAEGDWHSIAGHMVSEQLRDCGVSSVFLGASTPADDVGRFLREHQTDALVVSCALTLFILGVSRLAEAGHAAGVPVIVGGRAFVGRPEVALRIGADAYAPDVTTALEVLARWRVEPPVIGTDLITRSSASSLLDGDSIKYAWRAMDELRSRFPTALHYSPRQLDRTAEDLRYILRFAAASLYADDSTVFTEFLSWLVEFLDLRSVPKNAVVAGLEALQTIPEIQDAGVVSLLAEGVLFLS